MKIGVIGSGAGGLAVAIRLAAAGHRVTVWEKNERPGGKIAELRTDGFRFDTGPSLFTLPELTEELFALCGESARQALPYRRLETNCRYFWPGGSTFSFYQDPGRLVREIETHTTERPEAVLKRLRKSQQVYDLSAPVFLFSDFHKLSNFNTPPYKRIARQLWKLDFFRSMHGANRRDFDDSRLVQLFDRYATYNGSSPYRAPATLNMIAHLENNIGAFFPERGMYSIVDALYTLALRQGVDFRFGERVEQVVVEDKKAVGLRVGGQVVPYDLVVSDADARYAARELIPGHPLRRRMERSEPSSSALIFYWGVRGESPGLDLHNILFSGDYKQEFRHIFRLKELYDDPTVYLFISSKAVPDDAPPGCENWFVMINTPADCGQDWEALRRDARHRIVGKIDRMLSTDIESRIVTEHVADPPAIERNTLSARGALYGTSSNSALSAFLRHPNSLRSVSNLYFVGGSVHPGGGIPLCLASARIVADEIANRYADVP